MRPSLRVAVLAFAGCAAPAPSPSRTPALREARVLHDAIAYDGARTDLYLPRTNGAARWIAFVHEGGRSPPAGAFADALQRRGIGVASIAISSVGQSAALASIREVGRRAPALGLTLRPVLAGDRATAALVARAALDRRGGLDADGVIALNGVFDEGEDAPIARVRADAPRFLVLSAHDDTPRAAQSSRAFARALERVGSRGAHAYHVAGRTASTLTALSGEHDEVGDLVAAFVRDEPAPGGPESAWAVADAWGPSAPLSTEPFWTTDAPRIVRRPIDDRFRAELRRVLGDGEDADELAPWPGRTYDAIDLGAYLGAHPELGSGDWVLVTNARGERLVLRRDAIERDEVSIVVGIDDERNLFRLLVTYNVLRSYSWKPDERRPLLARPVGGFLYARRGLRPGRAITLADFALTTKSFRVAADDPLAPVRSLPSELSRALTNEQGCLQCHALRDVGARAHHLRASDGAATGGVALAFEEYPPDVLRRFLFEQDAIAKSFGVAPIRVDRGVAEQLLAALR